jgi:hypothetical protein
MDKDFKRWCVFLLMSLVFLSVEAQKDMGSTFKTQEYVSFSDADGGFPLFGNGSVAPLIVAENEFPGIQRVAAHLQNDLLLVTGVKPEIITQDFSGLKSAVIIGTLGQSSVIDEMVAAGKIDVSDVKGRWEVSLIQVVDAPLEGIDRALVIVGSDKRGTIFGMFDLSAQMGVSPWYWWADVPVEKQPDLYVKAGRYNLGEPKVQYRGIFLNDEEPALGGWVRENFGDFNADFYGHVYELLLRMKGNFLWPAMWGKAHADDDINNAILADEYGIVISYSHHEPMMRAHVEWERYGEGPWDYTKNKETLDQFWKEGVERNLGFESIITIGMRGDGDEAMSDDRNIDLMTDIVDNQRRIIEEISDIPAEEVPQVWALYKEVQEYYDMGMRVPDDIMLLYCDDNWGNVRRMPGDKERARAGGLGMYYHFDYVGGPRNYKWINTNPLPKIWEQNKLTYEHGVNKLWVVNVGDLKPMEFPIQFYLDLAWDPDRFEADDVARYSVTWARQQFGEEYAEEIGGFMDHYGKINGRRKPEMLDRNTYSLTNYREFERVADEYNALAAKAAKVNELIPDSYRDAYYQLVLYPIEAAANLYNLYHANAKNQLYAKQGRAMANLLADSVRYYYEKDSLMTEFFHTKMADGKWNHMMAQTRIGYTYWQQPAFNVIPKTERVSVLNGAHPDMLVEGQTTAYSAESNSLPEFDVFSQPSYFVELFNKGDEPFKYSLKSKQKWVKFSSAKGVIDNQERIFVSIDWAIAPVGVNEAVIYVKAGKRSMDVQLSAWNPSTAQLAEIKGFIETNGYVSIESSNYSKLNETDDISWLVIPDIGRTLDGVVAQPYMVEEQVPGEGPSIDYEVYLRTPGTVKVHAYFSPTLNYPGDEGLHYGISFDKDAPVVVNAHADESDGAWYQMVGNKSMVHTTEHSIESAGAHTLKYHMVSPGLVLQKIVVDNGGLKSSYLGPEESFKK